MKRNLIATLTIIITVVMLGCGSGNVKKAQELLDLGLFEQAVQLLESEIQNHPKNADTHVVLGNAYAGLFFKSKPKQNSTWLRKTAEKIIESYQSAIQLKPKSFYAHYNLAVFLSHLYNDNNFEWDDRKQFQNRMVKELEEVSTLQPNHAGVHIFLANIYPDERKLGEFQKALRLSPLGKEWYKLKLVANREEHASSGTFIVKSSTADLYSAGTGEPSEKLEEYDIAFFKSRDKDKLYFTDKKHPVYIPDKGWLLESYRFGPLEEMAGIFYSSYDSERKQARYTTNIITKDASLNWMSNRSQAKYPGGKDIVQNFRANSVKRTGKKNTIHKVFRWNEGEGLFLIKYRQSCDIDLSEVTFERIEYLDKWIDIRDVVIGTGSSYTDSIRVDFLKSPLLSEKEKEQFFNGFITTGMPMLMIHAVLGSSPQLSNVSIRNKGVTEVYNIGDQLELIFKDGQLSNWKEK